MALSWFVAYDFLFQIIFAVASFIIALFAFKLYKSSAQKQVCLLGCSFLLISLAYLALSLFRLLLNNTFLYVHIVLFMTGLAILLFMTLKTDKLSVFFVIVAITLLIFLFSINTLMTYYLVSAIFLAIISWHYILNFLSNRQTKTLLVALAFILLFFGSFHFFMSVNHELFYVIGHFLELAAYLFILTNLYLVLKK